MSHLFIASVDNVQSNLPSPYPSSGVYSTNNSELRVYKAL